MEMQLFPKILRYIYSAVGYLLTIGSVVYVLLYNTLNKEVVVCFVIGVIIIMVSQLTNLLLRIEAHVEALRQKQDYNRFGAATSSFLPLADQPQSSGIFAKLGMFDPPSVD